MNYSKILFQVEGPSGDDIESLWALRCDKGYRIDNVPFYACGVALDDVITVEEDADGMLWFKHVVEESGHSTVRLLFAQAENVPGIRAELEERGCSSEVSENPTLIAVDVPPEVPYGPMREYFDREKVRGTFRYEEGCLGQPESRIPVPPSEVQVDDFWAWFSGIAGSLGQDLDNEDLVDELDERVIDLGRGGLTWELLSGKEASLHLLSSYEDDSDYDAIAENVVSRAPEIPGWKVRAGDSDSK